MGFWSKFFSNDKSAADEVDEEMLYCPICNEEYRAGVEQCVTCEVALIGGKMRADILRLQEKEKNSRSMHIATNEEMVNLQQGGMNDIKKLAKILASERIPSRLLQGQKSCSGVQLILQVRKADSTLAAEIIEREFVKDTALSSHDLTSVQNSFSQNVQEVQQRKASLCPACNSPISLSVRECPDCGLVIG